MPVNTRGQSEARPEGVNVGTRSGTIGSPDLKDEIIAQVQSSIREEIRLEIREELQAQREASNKAQEQQAVQLEELRSLLLSSLQPNNAPARIGRVVEIPQESSTQEPVNSDLVGNPGAETGRTGHVGAATSVTAPPARAFRFDAISHLPQDADFRTFRLWKKQWYNNARVYRLSSFPQDVQVYSLVTALGPHATQIAETHHNIDLDDSQTTVDLILSSLNDYFRAQRNVAVDRVTFRSRRQEDGETFDHFRFALEELAV